MFAFIPPSALIRLSAVVTPVIYKWSTVTPPIKVDTPNTSNTWAGCVLPIPTLSLTAS